MYNLSTVIKFEVVRALKKKSFWVMAAGFPVMIAAIFGIVFLSNQATNDAGEQLEKQQFSVQVTDNSGLINPQLLQAVKATVITDKAQGIANVRTGKVDAYIYYPADLTKNRVEVFGNSIDIFQNGRYSGLASSLLSGSVLPTVSPEVTKVIQGSVDINLTTYKGGTPYDPFKEMILPGIFLVLFYLLIGFFGNQMLTSTTEEKENRVIEMILTTIEARTLIVGKILSLVLLAFIQSVIMIAPAVIGYLAFHNQLNLPSIDLASLPVNGVRIATSALIFAISFIMFTGLLVLIGSSVPTAKEAGQFFGMIMMLVFGPLYAASLFVSAPESLLVRFLSIFPLTAPIPLLLRNALGNLTTWETLVSIAAMLVASVVILWLAVRAFRFGALEYSRKLSVREILNWR